MLKITRAGFHAVCFVLMALVLLSSYAQEQPSELPDATQISQSWKKSAAKVSAACVRLKAIDSKGKVLGFGSGTVISADGLVATAAHVRMPSDNFKVVFSDGKEVDAVSLGADQSSDIALLRLSGDKPEQGWPCVPIAKDELQIGDFCFSIAFPGTNPKSWPAQLRVGRAWSKRYTAEEQLRYYMTDTVIEPGDSGGGLFDMNGQWVGLNSSAAKDTFYNRQPSAVMLQSKWDELVAGEIIECPKDERVTASKSNLQIPQEGIKRGSERFKVLNKRGDVRLTRYLAAQQKKAGEVVSVDLQMIFRFFGSRAEAFALGLEVGEDRLEDLFVDGWMTDAVLKSVYAQVGIYATDAENKKQLAQGVVWDKDMVMTRASSLPKGVKQVRVVCDKGENKYDVLANLQGVDKVRDIAWLKPESTLEVQIDRRDEVPEIGDVMLVPACDGWIWNWGVFGMEPVKGSVRRKKPKVTLWVHEGRVPGNALGGAVLDTQGRLLGMAIGAHKRVASLVLPLSEMRQAEKVLRDAVK